MTFTIITGLVMTSILSGCEIFDQTKSQEKDVNDYNKQVATTITDYAASKVTAEKHKDELMNFLLKDEGFDLLAKAKYSIAPALSKKQSEAFKIHNSVIFDDYYTSLGASSIREVIVIKGSKMTMYATIIWTKDSIFSIERKVKKDD